MKAFRLLLAVVLAFGSAVLAPSATYTVTVNTSSGAGSLREAIQAANANPGHDTIRFNIDRVEPFTIPRIRPGSALPTITDGVFIDGTSEAAGKVELDGGSAGITSSGLSITAGNCTIQGLVIHSFYGHGIELVGPAGNNLIQRCYIGTDVSGTSPWGNGLNGVLVNNSPGNSIGTFTYVFERPFSYGNVISGNGWNGIEITGASAHDNRVMANLIGTSAAGTSSMCNRRNGVAINNGAAKNTIGHLSTGVPNVISGNCGHGIHVANTGTIQDTLYASDDVPKAVPASPNWLSYTKVASSLFLNNENPVMDVDVQFTLRHPDVTELLVELAGPDGTTIRLIDGLDLLNEGANFIDTILDDEAAFFIELGFSPFSGRYKPSERLSKFDFLPASGLWTLTVWNWDPTNAATLESWSLSLKTAEGNLIVGNRIGTDGGGVNSLGNALNGLYLENSAGNRIGNSPIIARNIISGNGNDGIQIRGANSQANVIQANYVGVDQHGTADQGNTFSGVALFDAVNNVIGGVHESDGNIISGNNSVGVFMSASTYNRVQGNVIGTDSSRSLYLPNLSDGVRMEAASSGNLIGGTTVGAYFNYVPFGGNYIANNGGNGVLVTGYGGNGTGNQIIGNSFFSNGGLGIDLSSWLPADGMTPNDADDSDMGPNSFMNYPDITGAHRRVLPTSTHVEGALHTAADSNVFLNVVRLDFYASTAAYPGGPGNSQTYLAGSSGWTDSAGVLNFRDLLDEIWLPLLPLGQFVTATATDRFGSTSEFAMGTAVGPGAWIGAHITNSGGGISFAVGQTATYYLNVGNIGPDPASGAILKNMLPPTFELISASATQGTCSASNGMVICDLGTLPVATNPVAQVAITFRPTEVGYLFTNVAELSDTTYPPYVMKAFRLNRVRGPTSLQYSSIPGGIGFSVPQSEIGFIIETTDNLLSPIEWHTLTNPPVLIGDRYQYTIPFDRGQRFFRLRLY